jgi:hypothetical protein
MVVVGVADHAGWAALVAVGPRGELLDRRRVELLEPGLPPMPIHHEAQALPLAEAEALVGRVRASVARCAAKALEAVARAIPDIGAIALRQCPEVPDTVAGCLRDHRARNLADWVMYRRQLAHAAGAIGWQVAWFDPRSAALQELMARLAPLKKRVGPPWGTDQRLAMAGALWAAGFTSDNVYYVQ